MEKAQIIYGETEYFGRPDRTMQVVVIIGEISVKTLYLLNLGEGYEHIFTSINDLQKYFLRQKSSSYIVKMANTVTWIENYAKNLDTIDNMTL